MNIFYFKMPRFEGITGLFPRFWGIPCNVWFSHKPHQEYKEILIIMRPNTWNQNRYMNKNRNHFTIRILMGQIFKKTGLRYYSMTLNFGLRREWKKTKGNIYIFGRTLVLIDNHNTTFVKAFVIKLWAFI